jgi:hypothetical protein
VQLVAASLAIAGVVALAGWTVQEPRFRLALLCASAFTMLAWGFLGILSIGFPVFIAGVLLLVSAGRAADEMQPAEAWVIVPLASGAAVLAAEAVVATTV